jgi:hypothetical protein
MAKKSRRARRKRATRRPSTPPPSQTQAAQTPGASVTSDKESPTAEAPPPGKTVDFAAEYSYVINDLRSMGIIAILMLAVLVALAFVIR